MLQNDRPGTASFGGRIIDDHEGTGFRSHEAMVNRQSQMVNWPMADVLPITIQRLPFTT